MVCIGAFKHQHCFNLFQIFPITTLILFIPNGGMASKLPLVKALLCLSFVFFLFNLSTATGLRRGFYKKTCPNAELIVRRTTAGFVTRNPDVAAPLLRLHFHDCFVRGCDASVLLNSTKNSLAEKDAMPNHSLDGFYVIDAAKEAVEKTCPGVVSCADIVALAARDAVTLIKGPFWEVETGRRDGLVSSASEALANLPSSYADITQLKANFRAKGLSVRDLVVLSGAHTIGNAHCSSFDKRIYNFTGKGDTDPTLDPNYMTRLRNKCKSGDIATTVQMVPGSSMTFDADYYKLVGKRRGLFHSDAALLHDQTTKRFVFSQLNNSSSSQRHFFEQFGISMVRMGRVGVYTGKEGQIRRHCAVVNA